ncbi:hypothetical protein HRE53_26350 (plasmid) [Acaryochloris sp. 'Moss Beach']|uniref:hypothetical protein n=1 Tax=Acaryochloris sp. 'Moss Beach' TaxID=2740837 RepID=UPI001F291776|nr:hypothetical protein [Acaryochloris sp. 'Moss Beach']UJB72435.1 hypothetical protein HRE53_26350 [Acaryochloris sp. 'Moss Beach']
MAKFSVVLAAALMLGSTAILSPAQAAISSQVNTLQKLEDNQSLIVDRRQGKRICWRRYGRTYCRRDDRGRHDRWENHRRRENRRDRRWRNRKRWENRKDRWENRKDRNDDRDWRRGDKRGDYQEKLDRWLNRRNRNDD